LWICIFSLVIRHANRMFFASYNAIICSLSGCTIFIHIYHIRQHIRKTFTEHKISVLIFSRTSAETFLILRIQRHTITNVYTYVFTSSTCYFCQILIKLEFSRQFSKNPQISNFRKIRPFGTDLFHADGRTERNIVTNSHFSQFCFANIINRLVLKIRSVFWEVSIRFLNNVARTWSLKRFISILTFRCSQWLYFVKDEITANFSSPSYQFVFSTKFPHQVTILAAFRGVRKLFLHKLSRQSSLSV
jgi:hypothetical protein